LEKQKRPAKRYTEALRKRSIWLLLTLILLPVLISGIWYGRQVRQQHLDHALIEAIKREDTKTTTSLLDQGADANATDKPYIPMTLKSALLGMWDRIKGDKTFEDKNVYSSALLLPYHSGVLINRTGIIAIPEPNDNPELVKALLEHGANPYFADELGTTILHYAVEHNHTETVKVLLEHHVNPNIQDHEGKTPLWDAHLVCARLLIAGGAKVSIKDNKGDTMLQYVAGSDKALIPLLHEALKKEQAEPKSSATIGTK
jgi:hypothetical protein